VENFVVQTLLNSCELLALAEHSSQIYVKRYTNNNISNLFRHDILEFDRYS